jgi:hypothetical protein
MEQMRPTNHWRDPNIPAFVIKAVNHQGAALIKKGLV